MPTLAEVQLALQRCMSAEPPIDVRLSADALQLATVFAEMRYRNEDSLDRAALKPKQIDAFDRWISEGSTAS